MNQPTIPKPPVDLLTWPEDCKVCVRCEKPVLPIKEETIAGIPGVYHPECRRLDMEDFNAH